MKKEEYVARITNASPIQLVVITYELSIDYLKEALDNFSADEKTWKTQIENAQGLILNLRNALDMKYEISQTLFPLYVYVNKLLITCIFKKDCQYIEEAIEILEKLLIGFKTVEKNEKNQEPIMENAQKIYAGLTYSHNELEEYVEEDVNRGFKA